MFDFYNKEHVIRLPKNVKCPSCGEMIHDIILIFGRIKLGLGTGRKEVCHCPKCLVILAINSIERG